MNPAGRRGALLVGVAAAVVVLDQWTKSWAQQDLGNGPRHVIGPAYLRLTYNPGAAFSFGTGASPVIAAVAVGLVLVVGFYSRRLARGGASPAVIAALGLLAGGAVSNLADRLFRHHHGAVVDFIQLVSWWPTFNVADAAITVGALMLAIILVLFPGHRAVVGAGRPAAGTKAASAATAGAGAASASPGTSSAPGGSPDH
jgi:signal peptidase II